MTSTTASTSSKAAFPPGFPPDFRVEVEQSKSKVAASVTNAGANAMKTFNTLIAR